MPKKERPPPDDPKQSARFVETATMLEVDKIGGKAFASAVKKIIPKKKRAGRSSRP
jgi:hypothetical protein